MIIVKITSGLGNQLFQYAIGRALSLKLGCELVLDTSFYPQQTLRKYELDKFQIQARLATDNEIDKVSVPAGSRGRLIRKLGLSPLFHPNYIKELKPFKYVKAIDNCKVGSYLDGFWQNPDYFNKVKNQLREDFVPINAISKYAQAWLLKIKTSNSVSLHVRRGDYIQNTYANGKHGTCSLAYYQKSVEHIKQQIKDPIFFVFSDDIQWCKDNLGFIKNAYFIDDTKTAIDDLVLMQNCQSHIIANSTFSWWGAWFNDEGIVVAPKKWFSNKKINNFNLYHSNWDIIE